MNVPPLSKAQSEWLAKSSEEGHPFYGNQYTEGGGGGSSDRGELSDDDLQLAVSQLAGINDSIVDELQDRIAESSGSPEYSYSNSGEAVQGIRDSIESATNDIAGGRIEEASASVQQAMSQAEELALSDGALVDTVDRLSEALNVAMEPLLIWGPEGKATVLPEHLLMEQRLLRFKAGGDASALIEWFNAGADGQIAWGEPGSFDACVALASEHMDEDQAKGFCANRHYDATGSWPGEAKSNPEGINQYTSGGGSGGSAASEREQWERSAAGAKEGDIVVPMMSSTDAREKAGPGESAHPARQAIDTDRPGWEKQEQGIRERQNRVEGWQHGDSGMKVGFSESTGWLVMGATGATERTIGFGNSVAGVVDPFVAAENMAANS